MKEDMETFPDWLSNTTILLDTNFFKEAYSRKLVYGNFIRDLKQKGVVLVSISLVKYEFIRSRTIDVVRLKENYFYEIVDTILPYRENIDEIVVPTIEEYKSKMEGLPITDLLLATYLKNYKNLYLLTNDHHDFPTFMFTRKYIFNIEDFNEKLYALYIYKPSAKKLNENVPILDDEDIPF